MVTSKKSTKDALKLKGLVHRLAPAMIQDQVAEYIRQLKEGKEGDPPLLLQSLNSKSSSVVLSQLRAGSLKLFLLSPYGCCGAQLL